MRIYGLALSPFVQRPLLAGRFKGHEIEIAPPPGGGITSPEFAAISPMRRVPLLEDGALRICESLVIVTHLDEVLDGPSLLPPDQAGRARARSIAQIADGEFAAGIRPLVMHKAFGAPANPPVLEVAQAQVSRGLDAIEALLDPAGPWAAGPMPSVADAALAPFLILAGMVERMPGADAIVGDRPKLSAYRDRILADPTVARTRREMEEGFAQAAETRRQQAAQQQQ